MSRPSIKSVGLSVFGEAPHWIEKSQELIFVDFLGHTINRYDPVTRQQFKVDIGATPSMVVPVENEPGKYVVSIEKETKLKLMEWDGKSSKLDRLEVICAVPAEDKKNASVFNDGKCDPQGRLWIGTTGELAMDGSVPPNRGKLYSLGLDGETLARHLDHVGISNGLAWSPDSASSKFYYIDSMMNAVDVFDFDAKLGTLSNRQSLFDFKKNGIKGMADGMTTDAQGNIWVASYMGAKILHIDTTTGSLIDEIDFSRHTSMVTSLAFGGPNLDTLYVTSGNMELPKLVPTPVTCEEHDAGSLFEVTNLGGAKGVPGGGVGYKGKLKIV